MRLIKKYAFCLLPVFIFCQNAKIDSLTVRLAYQNQDSEKIETSLRLVEELFKIEDYKKAQLFLAQTLELSKTLNYNKGLAESHFIKALIYNNENDLNNAARSFEHSKKYFQLLNDAIGIARVDKNLGGIEIIRGNYAKGLENSFSAISVFEKMGLNSELNHAYSNLGDAYLKIEKYDRALEFYKKTFQLSEQSDASESLKQTLKKLGQIYAIQGKKNESIFSYERLLDLLNYDTDVNLRSEILPLLAQSYLLTNQLKKASEYVDEGLRYSREHNNKLGILKSLNVAGDLNIKKENLDTAEKQLLEAYKLAKNMNNKAELLYNLKLHTSLDSTRQFFEEAFNWQNQYLKLKQDIDIEAKAKAKIIFDKNTPPDEQTLAPVSSLTSQNSNSFLTYGLILTLIMILVLLSLSYIKVSRDNKLLKIYSEESKDLILKNNRLEELNQVKDKLFSIVSHDLKDSISSIKALLDLLKDDGITQQEFNDLIPELSENANNASSLLFNLLNWSKSQMQNLQPKPELFNIQEVFQIKTALIEKKIEDKGIILIDETRRDFVFADRSMLEIVIQNLITNAVKFSGKGDVITISNQDYNGMVLICVEDTGIGISKENIKKLFNAKKTFTTIGTENEKGTGLGLTICKDLVELNKGRIWVESTQNIGSKFFIELPKAALTD